MIARESNSYLEGMGFLNLLDLVTFQKSPANKANLLKKSKQSYNMSGVDSVMSMELRFKNDQNRVGSSINSINSLHSPSRKDSGNSGNRTSLFKNSESGNSAMKSQNK
jgi:hypothetical protein